MELSKRANEIKEVIKADFGEIPNLDQLSQMIEKYENEHNGNYHRRDILELAYFQDHYFGSK